LNNGEKIDEILSEIEEINDKRKDLTRLFTDDAMGKIDEKNNIIFYHSAEIEHGIIGIVAGRLTEQFHKPSIVLKDE
jgi:single-stranded-DNA-specific exonuclease